MLLQPNEFVNIHEQLNINDFFIQVSNDKTTSKLRQKWQLEENQNESILNLIDDQDLKSRILLRTNKGQLKISAHCQLINSTIFDIVIDSGKNYGKYFAKSNSVIMMSSKLKQQQEMQIVNLKLQTEENGPVSTSLSGSFDSKIVNLETEPGCTVQIMLSLDTKDSLRIFKIESALSVKNVSSKELLIQDQNMGNQR